MSANLITGNLFSPILASQDSDYQAGVSGDKTLILPVGAKMSLEIEDANTIRANDGVLVTKEGRRVQIDTGAVEEWSIPTGTQGETSYYLIGFHLYTTEESAEICETFIEKVSSATDTITENTFKGGATEVYITLGRVTQDGINLVSVEGLIDTADSLTDLGAKITQINNDLSDSGSGLPSKVGKSDFSVHIFSLKPPSGTYQTATIDVSKPNLKAIACVGLNSSGNAVVLSKVYGWILDVSQQKFSASFSDNVSAYALGVYILYITE